MTFTKCFALACCAAFASAQAPLKDPTLDNVIATVDGHNVTRADIDKMLDSGIPALEQMFQTDPVSAIMQYYIMQSLGAEGEKRKLYERSMRSRNVVLSSSTSSPALWSTTNATATRFRTRPFRITTISTAPTMRGPR